ncbi:MAG: creatininase family protein [Pirellulaceae bacterium]
MLLTNLTWPAISVPKETPVVIPIAAIEQHGHHLPLATDSMLLAEIVRRVESAMTASILVTPLMWLGNSDHHLDFPGTLSASPRTYFGYAGGVDGQLDHTWLSASIYSQWARRQ